MSYSQRFLSNLTPSQQQNEINHFIINSIIALQIIGQSLRSSPFPKYFLLSRTNLKNGHLALINALFDHSNLAHLRSKEFLFQSIPST